MNREMPEEETVTFDGRTVPVRVWESEVMLRCAAWVSILQSAAIAYQCVWNTRVDITPGSWWPVPTTIGLTLLGVFLIGSWFLRGVLVAVGAGFYLVWVGTWGHWEFSRRSTEVLPLVTAFLALAAAVRLFYRSPLARDGLMLLGAAWIACVFPSRLLPLDNLILMSHRSNDLNILMETGPIWFNIGPSVFVVAVLAARPGRALFATPQEKRRLASLGTILTLPFSARAWASLGMILVALIGITLGSQAIHHALRGSRYYY